MEYLVGLGAEVNAKSDSGWTPLHGAAHGDSLSVAEYLVGLGAAVNAKTDNGSTPLHTAAHRDSLSVAEYLVERGADVNEDERQQHTDNPDFDDSGRPDTHQARLLRRTRGFKERGWSGTEHPLAAASAIAGA